ncbi:DUF6530 family protein [Ereboglobus luteus]|uniref:DUF6530 family protein n=1 Tax=Ereboglobus luteus TaxID=1796921 RepID=UPI0012603865|nr:DUF6530 family protein [Ereboglobus luteus]
MPFKSNNNAYIPTHQLPHHLAHKPIYAMPYEKFDGMYINSTDASYLSVGLAQYDNNDVSAKVMRHTGQWSRQAEELPIHRPIDLSIFIAKALFDSSNQTLKIKGDTFSQQDDAITVQMESISSAEAQIFNNWLSTHSGLLKERLNSLCDTLNDLRRRGKI